MRNKTDNRNGNTWRMFALVILFGIFAALTSMASDVNLAWDASLSAGTTNYVLYAHTNSFPVANRFSAIVRLNVGTNLTARVEALTPGRWAFAVTAMMNGLESDLSNILVVEVPTPPANMRTVVVQYSGTLTNFYDVGFFRLRLP